MRPEATKHEIDAFLSAIRTGKKTIHCKKNEVIFSQGDSSTAMFYVETGAVKLSLVSPGGKEAVICIKDGGTVFGESCISCGQPVRFHSAVALTEMRLVKIDRAAILRLLHEGGERAVNFISFLLKQNAKLQEDLTGRLVGSTAESLARVISSIREFQDYQRNHSLPLISQQTIAEMMGITRQRVNALMKRSGLTQTRSRTKVVLPERCDVQELP